MPKYSSKNKVSEQTRDEAMKIAKGTQRPGQTKEQTRLIAQGIQKGIDQYKKQQKAKAREQDKQRKKAHCSESDSEKENTQTGPREARNANTRLPWILLLASWLCFALYIAEIPPFS